jgi:hypothetical protein
MIFTAGADPATATPIASQGLGKPVVVNGECTADVTGTFNALNPGSYQATVAAVATGGISRACQSCSPDKISGRRSLARSQASP